ncbi:diphosphate--fructose-6-phosphate 1-phosphotransferase [Pseudogracilibacillus sp. SO30301A]|uniref:diphosphate--fructose-6-phosphate 1-phosphotransferase n=1 Tax=Pseudogracilibacillus sp. SO30301A TaxID=3098291 RepID=UPI00300E4CCB
MFYLVKSNCIVVQSGGPTAVINNSLAGLIDSIEYSRFKGEVYGAIGGIQGLLEERYINLTSLKDDDKFRLRWTPGAALGTCRHKITFDEVENIINSFKKHSIHYFFYIGGNGSMYVANIINNIAIKMGYSLIVIGIPKSIDNDLLGTDHSPGYGSAAKFLATSLLDVKMDVASYKGGRRVTIIEAMGRHTGWLAAACSLATFQHDESQTFIYIPESSFYLEKCINQINESYRNKMDTFLIISEGIKNENGQIINENEIEYDSLNRPKLGGVSNYLNQVIEAETGIQTRSITPSIWQRSSILLSSKTDVEEAYEIGKAAWDYAMKEYSGVMIGMEREKDSDNNYIVVYKEKQLEEVASKEKFVPLKWYDEVKNRMTDDFISYVKPLIQGEMIVPMTNGLPKYKYVI